MDNNTLAERMSHEGFSDTIIRIQTGSHRASVTQLQPALPSLDSVDFDSDKAAAAISLVMNYLELWGPADVEVGIDALISAHKKSTCEQYPFPLTLEESWIIARECRCQGSSAVLNLLFSSLNQDC
ncbi:hypothetical protein HX798_27865 [Pseudomonas putida]|uniref:Uncharacterized protein n=1 Tax=Pseudomonas putida TaxID=303 RepID=A0A7Y7ZGX2_PSEPU|nr:hypothetical protein [Pseudomonas putida]NWC84072.1 hypothetical protein [Pseudomonas putida]